MNARSEFLNDPLASRSMDAEGGVVKSLAYSFSGNKEATTDNCFNF